MRKETLPRNPEFVKICQEVVDLYERKNRDYAQDDSAYSNFELAAQIAGITVQDGYAYIKGIKSARLKELLQSGKTPENEPIEDTMLDDIVYSIIRLADYRTYGKR